jgi:nucleoside-diphosphate-sugar epimerase
LNSLKTQLDGALHILIVGVGYVGSSLAELLSADGHDVVGIRRSPAQPDESLAGCLIVGDIHKDETLEQIPKNLDAVVYALSPGERSAQAYQAAFPIGLNRIIQATENARIVFVSSTSVYSQSAGAILSEESPTDAATETAQALVEAEGLLLQRGQRDIILRASGIYGPGRTRLISQLIEHELSESDRATWTNRIHRDDLARAILFLLQNPNEEGILLASDAAPATLGEMQDWVRLQNVAHLQPKGGESRTMARKNRRVDAQRLKSLGFSYKYPSFREGYAEILSSLKQNT